MVTLIDRRYKILIVLCHLLKNSQPLFQARNGVVPDRTSECGEDFPCECDCNWWIQRRYDSYGFNMKKVTKGNVTIKLWDLGGQPRFRSMWERYCRAVSAIVYVVDAADHDNLPISRSELHDLLSKSSLDGIPLLVVGNKTDKVGALSKQGLTDAMDLKSIAEREVCCFMVSCKNSTNIDSVIDWLIKHSKSAT